ncbi:MAG TPA: hypothetical protein VIS95_05575 [Solirubrobacterales bacterium]
MLTLARPARPPALAGEVHVWRAARAEWPSSDDLLRAVLAGYLDTDPTAVELRRGANGKPALADHSRGPRFNLSHSADLALIAVADREVGVDVERIRPRRSTDFYEGWARHEATVKCLGTGLSGRKPIPEPAVAVRMLDVEVGFVAALAVAGEEVPPVRLSAFEATHCGNHTKK